MIFFVCAAAGMLKSAGLSRRVRQLEGFIGALGLISTEIRYFASPVDALMRKVSSLPEYRELAVFGICAEKLRGERDFRCAWEESLKETRPRLALDDGDMETLLWFGRVLGTTDIEGQTASCERYGDLLRQRLTLARQDKAKRGKMYSSLGLLAGVFLFVVFI